MRADERARLRIAINAIEHVLEGEGYDNDPPTSQLRELEATIEERNDYIDDLRGDREAAIGARMLAEGREKELRDGNSRRSDMLDTANASIKDLMQQIEELKTTVEILESDNKAMNAQLRITWRSFTP